MAEAPVRKWEVRARAGFVLTAGALMTASCHHRAKGACGGCYARLYAALELMLKEPERAAAIAVEVGKALQAEGILVEKKGARRG